MQRRSSSTGDRSSAEEDEFFDAVELLEDDPDCPEAYSRPHDCTLSSGVEDDGGVSSHQDIVSSGVAVGGDETAAAASTRRALTPVNLDDCSDHARMNNNVKVESGHAAESTTETNEEGENNAAVATKPTLTKTLTPINLHSSPFRGQSVKSIESPLEALYSIGPRGSKRSSPTFSPTRTSFVVEAGDFPNIRPPPIIDDEESAHQNAGELSVNFSGVSNSNYSFSSDSGSSISVEEQFRIIDKDTGKVHDVRQVMKEIHVSGSSDALDSNYSLLPTREKLEHQMSRRIHWSNSKESDGDDGSVTGIPSTADSKGEKTSEPKRGMIFPKMHMKSSKMADKVRKGMVGFTTSRTQRLNRKRTSSADMIPSNAVYVRSSSRRTHAKSAPSVTAKHSQDINNDSSFNPMLLIKTIPGAHKGPAWCAAFSQNGRFLATGGGDGNVCIWAVSPKSKIMHPDGVQIYLEGGSLDTLSGDNPEGKQCVIEEEDTDDASSPVPPLHSIGTGPELATNLEILSSEPIQRFKDHTAHVIDLSWSRSNFLLSASLDSSVRLYHHSKSLCLHCFQHATYVASVAFHPQEDGYFISGGVDRKLRLWDITNGRVKEWAQAPDAITATRFTPDGKYAVAGLFHGQVYFYDAFTLKYYTQIACRNRSGKYSKGAKVTGISFVREERDDWPEIKQKYISETTESDENLASVTESLRDKGKDIVRRNLELRGSFSGKGEALRFTERMLVSTNDSRVRLFGLNDFQLVRKYKGHVNCSMQIRARLSESGTFLASGSETGRVFLWETLDKKKSTKNNTTANVYSTHNKAKSSNSFEASWGNLPIVTDSVFFRTKSVIEALLSSDQIFPFELGMDRVEDDMSSAAILTLDYDGTLRVFLRNSLIDNILDAATPRGNTMT
jgi:WD40 repeat protein